LEIIIPKKISLILIKQISKHSPLETKGALFAEDLGNDTFKIDEVYLEPKPGTTTFVKLYINQEYLSFQKNYHKFRKNNFSKYNYIGDWHSHPLFECLPSSYDVSEVEEDIKKSNAIFLVQIILKVLKGRLVGNAFYYTRETSAKKVKLSILNKLK
jgi:proteasome lid subunit RPN8/RPN11